MKKHINKILSWLVVVCMLFSSASVNVFAAELGTSGETIVEEQTEDTSKTGQETVSTGNTDTDGTNLEEGTESLQGNSETDLEETATAGDFTSRSLNNEEEAAVLSLTMGTKPANGTTTGNPFVKGTAGSNSFRIPAMVTLNDGTIVAAADARWNTTYDGGGLDTIVSYSTNNGANWNYTFANYLGDNGNTYNGSGSTAFIDPALATDGETVYMLTDLYPYGVALNGSGNTAPSTAVGFNDDGTLKLAASGSSTYDYYLKDGQIYDSSNNVVSGYTVDAYFNITGNGYDTNLFFSDSPYQVVRTGYLYLTKSTDGGKTWSEPTLIPNVKTGSEQVCLVGPGRGLVTSDGKVVFPVYSYNGSSDSQRMGFIYSTDSGVTWTKSSEAMSSMWSSEAAVVELNDGTLRFFYRNGQRKLYYVDYNISTSSWGSPVNTGIATNSNTQISAIKYSKKVDGKEVILVSCPTGSNGSGSADSSASARLNGKIFVGYVNSDNTMSWQSGKAVSVTSNNSQFMYSCLTELSDGKVAILYENQESAWGTGDNCYYTMDFQTYDLGLVNDSGNTETESSSTITDAETNTVVTASDGTELTSISVFETTVDGITGKDYVAYDITLNNGAYTGSADVSIPLPNNMEALNENQLTGFTVNTNGGLTFKKGTLKDGVYTFTAPHFSVQGVLSLADVTETKKVELYIGETGEFTDSTGNYEDNYSAPDTTIATIKVVGTEGQKADVEYSKASVTCDTLIVSNSKSWTAVSGYYYTPDGTNYYPVYAMRSSSGLIFKNYTYTWGYSTTSSTNNVTQIGTQSTRDTSTTPNIPVYTQSPTAPVPASTTITFTGVAAGETIAIVGTTQYNITVSRKTENVSISVGGTTTYTDSTAASGVTNSDTSVVKAEVKDGKITFTGLKDGTATVTTAGVVYNVTVNEGTPISIKENETTTISVDLNAGETVTWSSADSNYVGVAGKYDTSAGAYTNEAILAGQNVTESPVTVIATIKDADGNVVRTEKWLVTVTEGDADTNTSSKGIYFNIDTIENCTVYYSINGGELIPVNGTGVTTGNWAGNGTYKGHFNIMFFAAPDKGYALTYMSISGSADQYYTLSNGNPDGTGSDAWPFKDANASTIPSGSSDSAWKTGHGFRWALLEGNMTIDQMKVMFSNAIALGCDGATTITKNSTEGFGTVSSPKVCKFVAQKLPTVEKTIESITRDGTETDYTDGMKVELGNTINYSVVVTRYATNATYGTITYDNEKLNDELTNNNGISNPDMGTSTTSDKTYTYTTSLALTMDNYADVVKDGKITNTADFSYSYSSQYSAGSLTSEASAVADITVNMPEYVIDFGLPVSIDLSSKLGAATISSGKAKYGTITANGTSFTYTPNTTLKDNDHVTLTLANGQSYGVRIIPATTVYYEEGFATINGFTEGSKGTDNQITSEVGSKDHYGYDAKYAAENEGPSNGTEAVSNAKGSTAEFTFTGTGIDIFANCTVDTGNVMAQLFKADGTLVKLMTIKTAATGAYGNLVSTGAYNSVIASVKGLEHGDYRLKITTTNTDPVKLDGFRVYGTLQDEATNAAYASDLEENPVFFNLRDAVLTALSANAGQSSANLYAQVFEKVEDTSGAFIVSNTQINPEEETETLLNEGPKKEIYLKKGQSLVFKVDTTRKLELGLKAVNDSVTFTINGTSQTITSDTDMFYEITKTDDGTVTVTNTGDYILAVTNLKICDDPNAAFAALTEEDFNDALVALGIVEAPSEPEVSYADATLNISLSDESGNALGSTALTANGVVDERATFAAADIEAAVAGLVPEGYELKDASYSDVEVVYGETGDVTFMASAKETDNEEETEPEENPEEKPEQPSNVLNQIIKNIRDFFKNLFGK